MKCATCGEALALEALPELRGDFEGTHLELAGVKALGCGSGHERRPVYPEFEPDLLAALLYRGLPRAERSGWLRPRTRCGPCGGALAGGAAEARELRCRVWLERASPCVATWRGPTLSCHACGRAQLAPDPDPEPRLAAALRAALSSTGL